MQGRDGNAAVCKTVDEQVRSLLAPPIYCGIEKRSSRLAHNQQIVRFESHSRNQIMDLSPSGYGSRLLICRGNTHRRFESDQVLQLCESGETVNAAPNQGAGRRRATVCHVGSNPASHTNSTRYSSMVERASVERNTVVRFHLSGPTLYFLNTRNERNYICFHF